MIQKSSRDKILQEFFDCPRKEFHLRDLSRTTKLAQTSVKNHIRDLLEEELIIKNKTGIYPIHKANTDNPTYKLLKKQNLILRIHELELITYLEKELYPNCIVLFGSTTRGEDKEDSDIDLFVQSKNHKLDLSKFENKLKRKISIFFEPKFEALNNEIKNNIINGDLLYGYLKVF